MENLHKRTQMVAKNIVMGFVFLLIAPILIGLLFRTTVALQIGLIFSALIMLVVSPIILINTFGNNKKRVVLSLSLAAGISFYVLGMASVLDQLHNRGWGYVLLTPLAAALAGVLYCWLMYLLVSAMRTLFNNTSK